MFTKCCNVNVYFSSIFSHPRPYSMYRLPGTIVVHKKYLLCWKIVAHGILYYTHAPIILLLLLLIRLSTYNLNELMYNTYISIRPNTNSRIPNTN